MSPAVALGVALLCGSDATGAQTQPAATTASVSMRATVRSAGVRTPIRSARVMVVPAAADADLGVLSPVAHLDPSTTPVAWVRSAQTDAAGQFELDDLPATRLRVIVVAQGHARHEQIVDLTRLPRRGLTVFVSPDEDAVYRTVVESQVEPAGERVKSTIMEAEEVRTAPGSQGDPLRALQNLPGVARSPGGLGILVLRGASPNQNRVFLGGHALPRAFHSLAISSVVPAAAISRMEFIPSNFDARFGDATGGLVLLHPAELGQQGVHGNARVDFLGAGAVATGPVRKGGYLVSVQRGWVDGLLGIVERVDPEQSFLMPRYYDYQAFFEYPVGARGTLTARVLGAGDRLQSRFDDPNDPGGRPVTVFEVVSQFHRADLSYRVRHHRWSFWITPSFRFERNGLRQPVSESHSIRDDVVFSLRTEASAHLSRRVDLLVGSDLEVDRYSAENRQPFDLTRPGEDPSFTARGTQASLGVYTSAAVSLKRWLLAPGVRVSAFTLGPTARAALDPRVAAHWSFAPRWRWSMGAGLYSQSRVQQSTVSAGFVTGSAGQVAGNVVLPASLLSLEPRSGFRPVNGSLDVARAAQLSTALSRELGEFWFVEAGLWARARDNANGFDRNSDGSLDVVTSTWSSAYGLELLARRRLGPKLWGWVGYTLSRAEVRVLDQVGPAQGRGVRPTNFDQRHNLVVLASYRLPRRWRIGGRFRLVSGSPFTDVVGTVWSPSSFPMPGWGARNAARFPLFHQLDVRLDKSWLLQRVELGVYIDVQNVYNQLNPELYIYNYDYSRRSDALGMPIFPSLGMRIDY